MKARVVLFSVLCCCFNAADAAVLYVTTTGTGNCTSWANACGLPQALNTALAGDELWVKSGTYAGPIDLVNGVKMIGGFAGTESAASASDPAANVTILDGGAADRVIYSSDHANSTVLRGFTIQNGSDIGNDGGGALDLNNSGAIFVQCTFKNNVAAFFGGVMAIRGTSSPHFVNCKFFDNGTGSGTSVQPLGGGVVYLHTGSATFTNCLFYNNKAGEGGVIMVVRGSGAFNNCTLVNNDATFGDGGAVLDPNGRLQINNSILWGNEVPTGRAGPQIRNSEGYLSLVQYGDVQGGFSGTGNINSDPLFVNAAGNDFTLTSCSPCRNVGSNSLLPADVGDLDWDNNTTESLPKDLALGNRKVGGGVPTKVDMGAYEGPATCSE